MSRVLWVLVIVAAKAAALQHITSASSARPLLAKPAASDELLLPALDRKASIVLVTAVAAALSGGSISLLVFAALKAKGVPVPLRSLVASLMVVLGAAVVEQVGHRRREAFNGRAISEVGQALAISSSGWACFSAAWAAGFGSVLAPGRKPPLNAGAIIGCSVCAYSYAKRRAPSAAHVVVPFVSALVMSHLHVLLHEGDLPPFVVRSLDGAGGVSGSPPPARVACRPAHLRGRCRRCSSPRAPSRPGRLGCTAASAGRAASRAVAAAAAKWAHAAAAAEARPRRRRTPAPPGRRRDGRG